MKALTIIFTFIFGAMAGITAYTCLIVGKLEDERIHTRHLSRIIDRMRRTCNGCRKFPDAELNKIDGVNGGVNVQ